MGFGGVDDDETDSIVVVAIEISKAHGPGNKRGSREAAEDQRYGFAAEVLGQRDGILALDIR